MFPNQQDALPLPARPDLEQYKKLAKNLLKACKSQPVNPHSVDDWAERWVSRLVAASGRSIRHPMPVCADHWADSVADFVERQMISPARTAGPDSAKASAGIAARASGKARQRVGKLCNLAGAQFVIARSHGFRNWSGLVHHIQPLASSAPPHAAFETAPD